MQVKINWPLVRAIAYVAPAVTGFVVGGMGGFLLAVALYSAWWSLAPFLRRLMRR